MLYNLDNNCRCWPNSFI